MMLHFLVLSVSGHLDSPCLHPSWFSFFFFFNDTATTEIYTLSLHDALPILGRVFARAPRRRRRGSRAARPRGGDGRGRSEEHTSELQSHSDLVCRLLLEKKKQPELQDERSYVAYGTGIVAATVTQSDSYRSS